MSIGGPCLWVPSLSSPASSSLVAVTPHLAGVPRHAERASPSASQTVSSLLTVSPEREPGASLELSADMNRSRAKAENALATPVPMGATGSSQCPGNREMSSQNSILHRSGTARDDLPRVKLQIPVGNGGNSPMSRPQVGHLGDDTTEMSLEDGQDVHGKECSISPSDDKDESMGGDESHRSPTLDKKKMKRFRLTHNQTRFLMSEFTRQAHPDAAHRERLSREIPGLTPRQVQVWFQNRRAKLKRLTTNDRERMLKSRALPDDFDTTKVLRAPFGSRSNGHTPVASPHSFGAPNPDFAALRALRNDFFHRPNDDEYLVSPLSSTSTAGTYMPSANRTDGLPPSSLMFGRPAATASTSDLHRTLRTDYTVTRSSSLSEASSQPHSFHSGMQLHNRFLAQNGMPYMRQPMGYEVSRGPNGMVAGYEQHQPYEGSVSPTDSQGQGGQMAYDMSGSQQQSYPAHLAMSSQIPSHGRPLSTMQEYRPYSYAGPSGTIPYTHPNNSSNLSLPTSFAPSESGSTSTDQTSPQTVDSIRSKFNVPSYNYAPYIQQ